MPAMNGMGAQGQGQQMGYRNAQMAQRQPAAARNRRASPPVRQQYQPGMARPRMGQGSAVGQPQRQMAQRNQNQAYQRAMARY